MRNNSDPLDVPTIDIARLVEQLRQGDRAALSRLLTLATVGDPMLDSALIRSLRTPEPSVIAFTGSGGVGKSTLLGAVAQWFANKGESVGILACDPQSPVTRGALLGDRCRIAGTSSSGRIFIRSLATATGLQGIPANIETMLDIMVGFGFDRLFLETVGAGQNDVGVCFAADITALVVQPQAGDELQWEKAGILELADIVVISKCDMAGADRTIADLRMQLHMGGDSVPLVETSVAQNFGIDDLCRVLETIPKSSQVKQFRNQRGTMDRSP